MRLTKKATILGLGYVGTRIAAHLEGIGYSIVGTTRSEKKIQSLKSKNWNILLWSKNTEFSNSYKVIAKELFLNSNVIISTIPPFPEINNNRQIIDPVFLEFSRQLDNSKAWKAYISSTSVYGGKNGDSFNEASSTFPDTKRGKNRLEAEKYWIRSDAEIFRSAAIYGPGRSVISSLINKNAIPIIKKGFKFNRIYIDDLVKIILVALNKPRKKRIINLADGQPTEQINLWKEAERITGINIPEPINFENAKLSKTARSFWKKWRKIEPKVINEELKFRFKYPNYKSGLRQCWKEEQ